ncbi:hypothetical protein BH23ACT5_BH23ACT5_06700 [soil metagenome]
MTTAEVEQRLQDGLERVARLDERAVDDVRRDAIRDYLARRGIGLMDDLAATARGASLSDEKAMEIAIEEIDKARREHRR